MTEPKRDEEPESTELPEREETATRVLRTFLEEPMLWPVGLVLFLCASSFGALILVFAIRLRTLPAGIALLLVIFLTVWNLDGDIRQRRLRPTSAVVLAIWAGSAVVGVVLDRLGAL